MYLPSLGGPTATPLAIADKRSILKPAVGVVVVADMRFTGSIYFKRGVFTYVSGTGFFGAAAVVDNFSAQAPAGGLLANFKSPIEASFLWELWYTCYPPPLPTA